MFCAKLIYVEILRDVQCILSKKAVKLVMAMVQNGDGRKGVRKVAMPCAPSSKGKAKAAKARATSLAKEVPPDLSSATSAPGRATSSAIALIWMRSCA